MAYSTLPTVNPGDVIASSTWGNVVKSNFAVSPMAIAGTAGQFWQYVSSGVGQWAAAGATWKYNTADQTVSASTSFVDVTASSGTFAYAVAASDVIVVQAWLPMTFTSTGGAKFQFTGPASPTRVDINIMPPLTAAGAGLTPLALYMAPAVSTGAAFSSTFGSRAAGSLSGSNFAYTNDNATWIFIYAVIKNGATPGTVTLQYAQTAGSGTAVINNGAAISFQKIN